MNSQHGSVSVVRITESLRESAAAIVREAFPGRLKVFGTVPGVHRTGISRARAGCSTSPLFRLALWFLALRRAGLPAARARLMVAWLDSLVRRLWSPCSSDIDALSRAEQSAEAAETELQLAYALGDTAVGAQWLAALRRERAAIDELIDALEVRIAAMPGAAA